MTAIWHNGRFTEDGAVFAPNDRVRLGDGVFDTMMAIDGKLIDGNEHFKRLLSHAAIMRMETTWSISELKSAADELLAQNKFIAGRFVVNTIITRGPAERGLRLPDSPALQIVMVASPAPTEFPPIHAIIATQVRRNEGSPLTRIKSCSYGDNILAMAEAKEKGANEAILLNNKDNVACASGSNVFIVQNGKLYTPPLEDGTMDGLTRKTLIKKMGAKEKTLKTDNLLNNEGIYLTNSVRGAVPVQTLDNKKAAEPSAALHEKILESLA